MSDRGTVTHPLLWLTAAVRSRQGLAWPPSNRGLATNMPESRLRDLGVRSCIATAHGFPGLLAVRLGVLALGLRQLLHVLAKVSALQAPVSCKPSCCS